MDEALSRAGWICIVAIAVAYATYLFAGSIFNGNSIRPESIIVRDAVSQGQHHLSGMIMVPDTCDELTLVVKKTGDTIYQLTFATWSEPSITCKKQDTPRVFDTVVFAPSLGVRFTAFLDAKPVDIALYPTLAK